MVGCLQGKTTARCHNEVNKTLTETIALRADTSPARKLEATPGIEPGYAVLQTAASPLRHVAGTGAALYQRKPKLTIAESNDV
jgi:hypothetical protein